MINRVVDFIKENQLENKTIIVGFSGGYDSMCLLDILYKIKENSPEYNINVIAAHFNHNWRGAESMQEAEVCRLFAQSRGIEFYYRLASTDIKKTENDARIARYEFFQDAMENYDTDIVFTAHNKDDNAETLIYRIAKGTGLVGLKGIAVHRGCFYRPLIKVSRQEILAYCEKNHLAPNNDSSNNDTTYKRNYIRHEIIPMLENINPLVKDSINNLADVATSEDAIIEEYMSVLRPKIYENDSLNSIEYKNLSIPVKKRFIYDFIQKIGLDYDYKKINEIYDFIENNIDHRNGSTLSLATAKWLYVNNRIIEIIPRKENKELEKFKPVLIENEGEYELGNGKTFIIRPYENDRVFVFPEATANFIYVDLSKMEFPLTIRTRKEGDMITPYGMEGSMKLKKYLNSRGIERHKRDDVLLLTKNDDILWVIGAGLSNKISVVNKPTHVIEIR